MKRREFLATVLGALCAPFVPKPLTMESLNYPIAFDWPAIEAVQRPRTELFVTRRGKGYVYSTDVACSVEDFARLAQPHLEAAQRELAERIDRG